MTKKINGTYWRIGELAEHIGLSYGQVYNLISNRQKLLKLGTVILIPDSVAQEIIAQYKGNKAVQKDKDGSMAIYQVANALNMGQAIVYQLIQLGLPTVTVGKKKRIENHIFTLIENVIREYQEKYQCVPTGKIPEIYSRIKEKIRN